MAVAGTWGCGGPVAYQPPAGAGYVAEPVAPNPAADALDLPADMRACYDRLWRGGVTFELVERNQAQGVYMPIRVTSPIGGIWVTPARDSRTHSVMDCRLGLRLLAWAEALRPAGIAAVEHFSIYRPGATVKGGNKRSGHALGLAIDLGRLRMHNGSVLDVLTDWEERGAGDPPCPRRDDESWGGRVLRGAVCDAVDAGLFNVVLTPHYDADHQNHVHLELKPHSESVYIR